MMTRKRFNQIWEVAVATPVNKPSPPTNGNGMSCKLANRIIEAGRKGRSLALKRSK